MNAVVKEQTAAVPTALTTEAAPSSGAPTEPTHDKESNDGVDYASLFDGLAEDILDTNDGAEEVPVVTESTDIDGGDEDAEHPIIPSVTETQVTPVVPEPAAAVESTPTVKPTEPVVSQPVEQPVQAAVAPAAVEGAGRSFEEVQQEIAASQRRTQEAIQQATANRQRIIDDLAVNHYGKAIPAETYDEIQTSPQTVVPKLLAMVYTDAVQGVTANILQSLPEVVKTTMQQVRLAEIAESEYFKAFPMTRDSKYHADIAAYGKQYAKENPKATLHEKINYIGTAVCMKHKIAPPHVVVTPQPQVASRPGQPAPVRQSGTDFGQVKATGNMFEMLSQSMIDED